MNRESESYITVVYYESRKRELKIRLSLLVPRGGVFLPKVIIKSIHTPEDDSRDFYHTGRIIFYNSSKEKIWKCRCVVPNFMND